MSTAGHPGSRSTTPTATASSTPSSTPTTPICRRCPLPHGVNLPERAHRQRGAAPATGLLVRPAQGVWPRLRVHTDLAVRNRLGGGSRPAPIAGVSHFAEAFPGAAGGISCPSRASASATARAGRESGSWLAGSGNRAALTSAPPGRRREGDLAMAYLPTPRRLTLDLSLVPAGERAFRGSTRSAVAGRRRRTAGRPRVLRWIPRPPGLASRD